MIKEYLIIPFSGGLSPINMSYTYQFCTIGFLDFLEKNFCIQYERSSVSKMTIINVD